MARDNDSTGPTRLARQRSTSSEIHQSRLSSSGQLIVVANRLPVTITADKDAPEGTGSPSRAADSRWIGWPGVLSSGLRNVPLALSLQTDFSCIPVYLSAEVAERFYNGFSNSILWPFFPLPTCSSPRPFKRRSNSGDIVWVQDYHLCLSPVFLRDLLGRDPASMGEHGQRDVNAMFEGLPLAPRPASKPGSNTPAGINGTHGTNYVGDVQIGYFLHTPFPSSEVFRTLPVRREILLGILNCDLIGFHTYDYARHFISSCSRLLGLKCTPNRIELVGRHASVGTFPIGIEPSNSMRVKLIVGVDRLDYIKGVPQKLHAMEVFLEEHPNWMPIHFMHRSVPFSELTALYTVSDACLITSTRDGMNLVAYEYIACQRDNHGVLILSEFAGAAHSLNGSLIVNPWNTAETGEAIHQALTMPRDEREENHRKLYRYVSQYTASHGFVAELQRDRAERRAIAEGKEGDESAQAAQLRRQGLQLTGKA
ncbi:alpha,alpha-trehalose-phosphate synthase, glycosyltransferase family 20 protein [Rhodotorula toruloides]|uniref:Alpha,alpha-trehalose-phosphate synthase, glycosyltransferase family 20 protein n=1 Tax=Rhodotorula toruloides TaxID=5286 RepID=A0A511KQY4_RHOTO|nr:alpha,alpha-trehalose-phosphate synthase, glycosyltransferase family 20 protein [Rhodotorula toruloides]